MLNSVSDTVISLWFWLSTFELMINGLYKIQEFTFLVGRTLLFENHKGFDFLA